MVITSYVCDVIPEVCQFTSAALLAQNSFELNRPNKAKSAVQVSKTMKFCFRQACSELVSISMLHVCFL